MVRMVITPHQKTISFEIPQNYVNKEIEVIAFAKGEVMGTEVAETKKVSFKALSLDTTGFKFNRDEANER